MSTLIISLSFARRRCRMADTRRGVQGRGLLHQKDPWPKVPRNNLRSSPGCNPKRRALQFIAHLPSLCNKSLVACALGRCVFQFRPSSKSRKRTKKEGDGHDTLHEVWRSLRQLHTCRLAPHRSTGAGTTRVRLCIGGSTFGQS